MQTILNELYNQYSHFVPDTEAVQEIENAHEQLRGHLEKPERKLVLRIIDNKDLIAGARARESFAIGFWLAWRLLSQLHNYDSGRSLEKILNVGDRFDMPQGATENEEQS